MHFEHVYALLALGHAVAAQNSTYSMPSISDGGNPPFGISETTPGSTTTPMMTSSSGSMSTSSSVSQSTVGAETVSLVDSTTLLARQRRAGVAARQAVEAVYVCPIYAEEVPDAPCYPCAVGEPTGQQTLFVQTTSTLGVAPDPTPIFFYSFCIGCEGTLVTTSVPGYTPGSRDFATCLPVVPPNSLSSSTPTPTPSSITSRPPHPTSKVGPPGITTNIYVTATIYNLIEIVSYCPTNGARKTILEQSTSCSTYSTCVTIPPELCTTTVSTKHGAVVTYTQPVETWTQMLTTAVTSTVSTITVTSPTPVETVAPAGYTAVATSAAAESSAEAVSAAAAASTAATTEESSPAAETYVTAGAGQTFASVSAVVLAVFAFFLV